MDAPQNPASPPSSGSAPAAPPPAQTAPPVAQIPSAPSAPPAQGASSERAIYLKIFEHSKDSVFLLSPENATILFANPRAVEDTSYEAQELEGLDFRTLFLPEDQAAINTLLETTIQWKTGVDPQRNLKRKTGRKIYVEISSSVVDFQGTTTIFCNVRDITARIKAEEKILQYSKELETINSELEDRVKARTSELASANEKLGEINSQITRQKKELDDVMSNIQQAIFTVSPEFKINPEHSRFVSEVFGEKQITGSEIVDFLYVVEDREKKGKGLKDALKLTFEQPETWDLVKDLLPKQLKYVRPNADGTTEARDLKFEWCPISDEGKVFKLMVVCMDITEQKRLEEAIAQQEAEHNEQLELISQLINLPADIVSQFVNDSKRLLVDLKDLIAKAASGVTTDITQSMMRTMHTLKGSARQFGLRSVQTRAHEIESKVSTLTHYDQPLLDEFALLEKALLDVHAFYDKTVGKSKSGDSNEGEQILIPLKKIELLLEHFPVSKGKIHSDLVHQSIHWLIRVPIRSLFDGLQKMAQSLAEELMKEVEIERIGDDLAIDIRLMGPLNDAFLHVVRNTMDHGAEMPDDREAAGKPRAAKLRLKAYMDSQSLRFEIEDDGQGVNIDRVKERALSRNLITPEKAQSATDDDIVQYIFLPGFSTKEVTTELSGRGVGMDVVKEVIEKKFHGEVVMHSQRGKGTRLVANIPLSASGHPPLEHSVLESEHLNRQTLESQIGISLSPWTGSEQSRGGIIASLPDVPKVLQQKSRVIVLGQLEPKELVDSLLSTHSIHHFVNTSNTYYPQYLSSLLRNIGHITPGGLESFLTPGSNIQSVNMTVYAEKNSVIEGLIKFTENVRGFRGLAETMSTIADEMIMNGMFDAPRDENGKEKYNQLPRTHPLVLEDNEAIRLKYGADSHFIGISVTDPFGALSYDTLVKYLKRCYEKKDNQIEQKKGGAGLGLFTIFDNAHCFVIHLKPGKKTEMIALISLSLSYARYQSTGKSISFFTEGDHG